MNFNFGVTNTPKGAGDGSNTGTNPLTPKSTFGFGQATPASNAAATPSFGFGAGSAGTTTTPSFGTGFQTTSSPAQPAQGFSFGSAPKTTAPTLSFGGSPSVSQPSAGLTGFNFSSNPIGGSSTATPNLSFGLDASKQTPAPATSTTAAPTAPGLNFGFGAKTSTATPTPAPSFGFGTPAKTTAPTLSFNAPASSTPATSAPVSSAALPAFSATPLAAATGAPTSISTTTTTAGFTLGTGLGLTSLSASKPGASATTNTSTLGTGFALPASSTAATTASTLGGFGIAPTSSAPSGAVTTTVSSGSVAPVVSMNFSQLEENINKWTLELEEQEKVFMNQATQVNAWDQLLIENGDKIVMLNESVERIKQDQFALDHELDFIVSQQIELEDMIAPLERELSQITIRDPEREQSYQLAENLDTQLKQMAEDLKEIIEHLNESNKAQDVNDPIVQIGRILNAHMSSLQWVDSSTAQINAKLQQVERMQETLRSSTERAFHRTFD